MPLSDEEKRAKNREACRRYREQNPEKFREIRNESMRRYRAANPEKSRAEYRRRYAENPRKFIDAKLAHRRANPEKARESAARRARILRERTPRWVSQKEMREVYRRCPGGMHVDHIVPLWGLTADGYEIHGLHVPWNLSYLTPAENIRKGNRMRPTDHYAFDVTDTSVSARDWRLRMSQ